jgi:hypothetical protein
MRTVVVTGLTLAFLGGSAIAVTAALDGEPDPDQAPRVAVYFTSTGIPTSQTEGTFDERDDIYRHRDAVIIYEEGEASDPRLSGTTTVTFNVDVDPWTGEGIMWGTMRIENEGGTWEGTYTGMEYEPPEGDLWANSAWLTGSGDYAGYSVYMQSSGRQGEGSSGTSHGVIFKGQPPVPEAPAE